MPKVTSILDRYEACKSTTTDDFVVDIGGLAYLEKKASEERRTPFEIALPLRYIEAVSDRHSQRDMYRRASTVLSVPGDLDYPIFGYACREAEARGVDAASWVLATSGVLPERRSAGRRQNRFRDSLIAVVYRIETGNCPSKNAAAEAAGRRLGLPDSRHVIQKADRRARKAFAIAKARDEKLFFVLLQRVLDLLHKFEAEAEQENRAAANVHRSSRHAPPIPARGSVAS